MTTLKEIEKEFVEKFVSGARLGGEFAKLVGDDVKSFYKAKINEVIDEMINCEDPKKYKEEFFNEN